VEANNLSFRQTNFHVVTLRSLRPVPFLSQHRPVLARCTPAAWLIVGPRHGGGASGYTAPAMNWRCLQLYTVSHKNDHAAILIPPTWHMLIDFHNSFTSRLRSEFAVTYHLRSYHSSIASPYCSQLSLITIPASDSR